MNRKSVFLAALAAGLLPLAASAQVSPAPPASAATPPAPVVPQAIPAKIALIAFEQAVMATNEGQRAGEELQKKYEPQKTKISGLGAEIESLKKQADAGKATMPPAEYASRLKTIESKEKQLNLDAEDATNAYNAELQEIFGKVAQKFNVVMQNYVKTNGFTLLLNVGTEQTPVMWAVPETDVTEAVINAYNTSSGVAAPTPAAPSATRPRTTPAPKSTTPTKPPTK